MKRVPLTGTILFVLAVALAGFRQVEILHIYSNAPLRDFAMTPDSRYLIAVGDSTKVYDWNTRKVVAEKIEVLRDGRVVLLPGGGSAVFATPGAIKVRKIPSLEPMHSSTLSGRPTALALSHDGTRLAVASCLQEVTQGNYVYCANSNVSLVDLNGDSTLKTWDGGEDKVTALQFTADDSHLLAGICADSRKTEFGHDCTDGRAVAWDTGTFEESGRSPAFGKTALDIALSPDNSAVAVATRSIKMTLLSLPNLKPLSVQLPESQAVGRVIFSLDGKTLYGSSRDRIRAWSWPSGKLLSRTGVFRIQTLRWSANRKQLLAGNDDGDLFVFDVN
ncbi:MAG: WD40 repeat domain-containing protein [bacterium]